MTPLGFLSKYKSDWWSKCEAKLRQEYSAQEAALRQELKSQSVDLLDLHRRNEGSKTELARVNEDLRDQIKAIEAKAHPSEVWANAFREGFSKAWDIMLPMMRDGIGKSHEVIFNDATEEVLRGLEPHISERMVKAGKAHLRPMNTLLSRKAEFESKRKQAKSEFDRMKYTNFITAINWMLNGNSLLKD